MEKQVSTESIFDGKIIKVTRDKVKLENEKYAFREVVHHHGGVCILAVKNNKILLVKQYRYPNKWKL